jgi:hypothetical protein
MDKVLQEVIESNTQPQPSGESPAALDTSYEDTDEE